jgi:hypothetical protein
MEPITKKREYEIEFEDEYDSGTRARFEALLIM